MGTSPCCSKGTAPPSAARTPSATSDAVTTGRAGPGHAAMAAVGAQGWVEGQKHTPGVCAEAASGSLRVPSWGLGASSPRGSSGGG